MTVDFMLLRLLPNKRNALRMTLALDADTADVPREDLAIDAAAFERLREAGLV